MAQSQNQAPSFVEGSLIFYYASFPPLTIA